MQTFHPMGRSEKLLEQCGRKLMMGHWDAGSGKVGPQFQELWGESSGLVQKLNSKEGRKVILSLQSLGAGRRYGADVG